MRIKYVTMRDLNMIFLNSLSIFFIEDLFRLVPHRQTSALKLSLAFCLRHMRLRLLGYCIAPVALTRPLDLDVVILEVSRRRKKRKNNLEVLQILMNLNAKNIFIRLFVIAFKLANPDITETDWVPMVLELYRTFGGMRLVRR